MTKNHNDRVIIPPESYTINNYVEIFEAYEKINGVVWYKWREVNHKVWNYKKTPFNEIPYVIKRMLTHQELKQLESKSTPGRNK